MSFEFWSKGDGSEGPAGALARIGNVIVEKSTDCTYQPYYDCYAYGPTLRMWNGGTFTWAHLSRNTDYAATSWRHYVVTHDGTMARLFVDGELVLSLAGAFDLGDGVFTVGQQGSRTYDEAALYTSVLSLTDIGKHFSFGRGGKLCQLGMSGAYPTVVNASGPKSFWRFNEASRIAWDSVGCLNGTYRNGSNLVSGIASGDQAAVIASGVSVQVGSVFPTANQPISIEMWSKGDGTEGPAGTLARLGNFALEKSTDCIYQPYYDCYQYGPTLRLMNNNTYTWAHMQGSIDFAADVWRHYVITHDGTTARLFVDGELVLALAGPWSDTGGNLRLGEQAGRAFDEVALYDGVLSAADIGKHYSQGRGGQLCQTGTTGTYPSAVGGSGATGFWRLNDAGRIAWDRVGCRNGTYRNGSDLVTGAIAGDQGAGLRSGMAATVTGLFPSTAADQPVSFEFWSKGDGTDGSEGTLAAVGNLAVTRQTDCTNPFYYDCYGYGPTLHLYVGGATTWAHLRVGAADYAANVWRHYLVTYDGSVGRLYVDGVLTLAVAGSWSLGSGKFVLGEQSNRVFDEAALYPTALSPGTAAAHFALGTATTTTTTTTTSTSTTTSTTTTTTTVAPPPPGSVTKRATGVAYYYSGIGKNVARTYVDPINTASGAFMHIARDLEVPGKGVSLAFTRGYDSTWPQTGRLGFGWGDLYDQKLTVAPDGVVTWSSGVGGELTFTPAGGGFTAASGSLAILRINAGGLRELVSSDQVVSTFDASGRLTRTADRSDQGLAFGYNAAGQLISITDAAARVTTLTYAASGVPAGRLTQVKGSDNRTVKYAYASRAARFFSPR